MNEPWNLTGLSNRTYIEYVPNDQLWDDHPRQYAKYYDPKQPGHLDLSQVHLSQLPSQTQCLYTAKKYGYNWIVTTDVDEYIYVAPRQNDTNQTLPFPSFLSQFDPNVYSSLIMNSIPFGRNIFLTNSSTTDGSNSSTSLMIDYVWRRNFNLSQYPFERFKQIYNPRSVWSVGVHYCWYADEGTLSNVHLSPEEHGIHIQHYKKADQGVFKKGNKLMVKSANDLRLDPSLRDAYREDLVRALRDWKGEGREGPSY
jgi:hypothetical protein